MKKYIKITPKMIKDNFSFKISLKDTTKIESLPVKGCDCFTCWNTRRQNETK
jgi:hypothetical protein